MQGAEEPSIPASSLVRAVDKSTAIPGGSGTFLSFGPPSLGFDNLIFRGNGSNAQVGIYFIKAVLSSVPQKVIARGDSLDGKVVDSVDVGRESIDDTGNQQFAFWVKFTDQSEGIFVATNVDCMITADDSVPAGSTGNMATAPSGPGVYSWAVNGGILEGGDGTNQITYTAGSGPDLTIDLTISIGTVSADCRKTVQVTRGDVDNDGDVDLSDFNAIESCTTGPGVLASDACRQVFDFDGDDDVDFGDWATFQIAFTGQR